MYICLFRNQHFAASTELCDPLYRDAVDNLFTCLTSVAYQSEVLISASKSSKYVLTLNENN